jgi:hypothetical protein
LSKDFRMNQHELNRQVARVTGESVQSIGRRGFSLWEPEVLSDCDQLDCAPQVVDWDAVEAERIALAILA